MKPKIFITRNLPGDAIDRVRAVCEVEVFEDEVPPSKQVLLERSADKAGLLVLLTDRIDAEIMNAAPDLRVVSNYAVGYDNIDIKEATLRNIKVGNTPSVLTETTADLAFALLMSAARRIVEGRDLCVSGGFRAWSPSMLLGSDVYGAVLGIIGMGRIGRAMARRAKGFSMKVIFCSSDKTVDLEIEGAARVSLEELLAQSDFISLHTPLNNATRHLINKEALFAMKPTAVLINTARGGCIDQHALVEALESKRIACAALDVTDPEPLPNDHKLLRLPNCLVIPHLGSASFATRSKMAHMAVDNLLAGIEGRRLPNCVN
jgi:glyoxylate reductase